MIDQYNKETLAIVLKEYGYSASNCTISPLGNGHINATYLIESLNDNFVLQCINTAVFPNPLAIFSNTECISHHLKSAFASQQYSLAVMRQRPNIHKSIATQLNGDYWRALEYVNNSYTVESVENIEQAFQAASAFAEFSAALSNLPTEKLTTIIPKFHDIGFRMLQLNEAVKIDKVKRRELCEPWINFCKDQQRFIDQVSAITLKLPLHVTHNDTKINNLLFNKTTNKPQAVIDLDTCMPGYLMHDFGDMVRTCCSNLAEDATNVAEMSVKMDIFAALANGYISTFGEKITTLEKQSLIIGAKLLPFMIGVRFLTDYLDGDNYFGIKHADHNLERAINQFTLYQCLCEQEASLSRLILSNS